MRLAVAAPLLVLVFAAPAAAQTTAAEEVEAGHALYLRADFRGATAAFDRALSSESLTPADALEAHRHLAALLLAVGTESEARAHAAAAVALDPAVAPPEGAPAELDEMLDEMRGERATIVLEPGGELVPGGIAEIRARAEPAPERLYGAMRLQCDDGVSQPIETVSPPPEVRLELPLAEASVGIDCVASALSRAGAELLTAEQRFALGDAVHDGSPAEAEDDGGVPLWPFIVGGVAVAAAAAIVIALAVASSSGSDHATVGSTTVEGW